MTDASNGYERIAQLYIHGRGRAYNGVGAAAVRTWATRFSKGSAILDLGCGTGIPVTKILVEAGMNMYAVDASPSMVADFRQHFPDVPVACEAVEASRFFERSFDGIISVGLLFLLTEATQRLVIARMAAALQPGGRLLFTSPAEKISWNDAMTEERSRSLGAEAYIALLQAAGLLLEEEFEDEGGNHYYGAVRPG